MASVTNKSYAESALAEINLQLTLEGLSASYLQQLPSDKVKISPFDDKKHDRPNTKPVRMYFGQIKEGKDKDLFVWILLQHNHPVDRAPEQRFNIFDRSGDLKGQLSAEVAVQCTSVVAAFRWLKKSGVADMDLLRAVIKYYFIAKGVSTSSPWMISPYFVKSLKAACILATKYETNAAANREMGKARDAARNLYSIRPSVPAHDKEPSVKVKANQQSATATPSVAKARRTPQPSRSQRAPTVSMIPSAHDASNLFIPEGPQVLSAPPTDKARTKTPVKPKIPKAASIPPSHPHTKTTMAKRSQSVTVSGANGFLIHSDTEDADTSASMDISQSPPSRTGSAEVLREKSPNSLSPADFVPAYRKAIDAREACQEKIDANKKEQEDLLRDMQLIETRLSELREEERKLEEEHRLAGVSKKRLRESLSAKERELLMFGFEIARRESKRLRTEMVSGEGTGEEGD